MMKLLSKTNIKFIGSAGIAIIIFFVLIFFWYSNLVDNAINSHQQYQLQMGKTLIAAIEQSLNNIQNHLERIEHELEESDADAISIEELVDSDLLEAGIDDIFYYNNNIAISLYKPQNGAPELNEKLDDFTIGFQNLGLDSITKSANYLFFKRWKTSDGIVTIAAKIKMNRFIRYFTKYLELSKLDFVWVLDSEGYLVYHPKHNEMVMRNIFKSSYKCKGCHKSFEMQQKMLKSSDGSAIYLVGKEEKKVMSHINLKYANISWVFAVSTYYTKIIGDLTNQFELLGITAVMVFFIIGGSFTANYLLNIKRLKEKEEKKLLEKERYYQDSISNISKLASMGELVDTVAHEINTPVGIISALIDNAEYSPGKTFSEEEIEIIKKQISRITKYTKSLLNYSQRLPFNPDYHNMQLIVKEIIALLRHRIKTKKIKTNFHFPDDLPEIRCDKDMMEQVFFNIINNAIDFIEPNGKLNISLNISEEILRENVKEKVLKIIIENSGEKIPDENKTKIFDAFFTTKEPGKGTGLGLYIAKNIILRHEGKIFLDEKSELTRFVILLPVNLS